MVDLSTGREFAFVIEDDEQNEDEEERRQRELEKMVGIVQSLASKFAQSRSDRRPTELRWLEDLRQFHGMYEAEVEGILKDDPERSKVFINLTRPKSTAWEARLWDLLFPADGKNWGINPTPVPDIHDDLKTAEGMVETHEPRMVAMVDRHNALMDQAADPSQPNPDPQEQAQLSNAMNGLSNKLAAIKDYAAKLQQEIDTAKRAAELMEREVDDQLVECRFPAISRDVIADACKLGSGIMKGPVTTHRAKRAWVKDPESGSYMLASSGPPRPMARRVNPWHFFPDMEAHTVDDMEYCFERHLKNRSQLIRMSRELGFNEEAVEQILREGPQNDITSELAYLSDLQQISDEYLGVHAFKNKYVVIEYHGPLTEEDLILMLRGLGRDEDAQEIAQEGSDPMSEHDVVAYFCQGRMLKIAPDYPMDSGEKLYNVFSFEKGETNVLDGKGVPRLMRSEQAMLNSSVRMLLDNGALSAAPQIGIDKTRVEPENGRWKFAPRKVWLKKGQDAGPADKAFEVFSIPANLQQLMMVVELAMKLIDDVITMPMIAQGEQGQATGTLGGMSMLFNSANVVFRRVVKNWDDDITAPLIRRFYDWNMQFSDKPAIKGDMQCEARGTSVLLVREVQSQQLMAIAMQWSTHPVIGPAVRVYEALRLTLQALAINPGDVLVNEDEFEKRVKQMAENPQPSPDELRSQATLQAAQIGAKSKLEVAQIEQQIAKDNLRVEIMKLMQKDGADTAKLQAMLEQTRMTTQSGERKLAVETAVEQQAAQADRAAGLEPTGSGGYISLGAKKE